MVDTNNYEDTQYAFSRVGSNSIVDAIAIHRRLGHDPQAELAADIELGNVAPKAGVGRRPVV